MKRKPVKSSNIHSIGYTDQNGTLEIAFLAEGDKERAEVRKEAGDVYRYLGVPPTVHDALMRAESKGKYFHRNIRDLYPFEKIKSSGGSGKKKKGAR
jgi:hypothetical protein